MFYSEMCLGRSAVCRTVKILIVCNKKRVNGYWCCIIDAIRYEPIPLKVCCIDYRCSIVRKLTLV